MVNSLVLLGRQAKALDDPLPCQRENPQLWFSDLPADLELAKAYCQPCPMRRFCLAGAVERHEPHGVWGGEIFTHGAIISEKRSRGRPPSRLRRVIGVELRAASPPGPVQPSMASSYTAVMS
jgi:WhiB family redox-sensing transcriptional regulator